ncbi:VOC family protein [Streptomyces sp. NPDC001351]|uniref:VOC family protein n=1 Tax=Streptomyces sp. NPDC001351 TaxID=3364564 RepID=UPI0036AA555B
MSHRWGTVGTSVQLGRRRGVEILKPLTTQPWGRRRSVWLCDPDGNIVNLYQEA